MLLTTLKELRKAIMVAVLSTVAIQHPLSYSIPYQTVIQADLANLADPESSKDLGNVLVTTNKNTVTVFVSQIFPDIPSQLKQKLEALKRNNQYLSIFLTTGLDWILKQKIETKEEIEIANEKIKNAITWLSQVDLNNFKSQYPRHIEPLKCFCKKFKIYLESLQKLGEIYEADVFRPPNETGEQIKGSCVTDRIGWQLTRQELDVAIDTKVKNLAQQYCRLKILTGLIDAKRLRALDKKQLQIDQNILQRWLRVLDYVNHATHTEVQMLIAKNLGYKFDNVVYSTKLPCWSCVRLKGIQDLEAFYAFTLGIAPHEVSVYPKSYLMPNGTIKISNLAKEASIANIKLKLLPKYRTNIEQYVKENEFNKTQY